MINSILIQSCSQYKATGAAPERSRWTSRICFLWRIVNDYLDHNTAMGRMHSARLPSCSSRRVLTLALAVSKKHLWNRPGICAGFILVKISQSPKMSKYLKGFPSSQWKRGNTSVLYTVCLYRGNVISKLCEFVGSHTFLCVFHIDMNGGEAFLMTCWEEPPRFLCVLAWKTRGSSWCRTLPQWFPLILQEYSTSLSIHFSKNVSVCKVGLKTSNCGIQCVHDSGNKLWQDPCLCQGRYHRHNVFLLRQWLDTGSSLLHYRELDGEVVMF